MTTEWTSGGNSTQTMNVTISGTYMRQDPGTDGHVMPPYVHETIGVIYLFSGIFGLIGNGALARKLKIEPPYRETSRCTLHLSLAVTNAAIVGGFPLTAPSCFAHRWLFGNIGCQLYGFWGISAGISSIYHLMFIAVDVYRHRNPSGPVAKQRSYLKQVLLCWVAGFSSALMPLLGWSSYFREPSDHSCNINWTVVNPAYISYILCITLLCYGIPFSVMSYCFFFTAVSSMKSKKTTISPGAWRCTFCDVTERNMTKLCGFLTVFSLCSWTPYAVLCLNSFFNDPRDVPVIVSALPGVVIKVCTCLVPLSYLVYIYTCTPKCEARARGVPHTS